MDDRDGNEWSCTREKTKKEAKKAMERCLLIDAKIYTSCSPPIIAQCCICVCITCTIPVAI